MFFLATLSIQIAFDLMNSSAITTPSQKNMEAHYNNLFHTQKFNTIDGKELSLEKISSKSLLIVFWASWCIPCMTELPDLIKLASKKDKKELTIIGINGDEKKDLPKVNKIIKELGINFPIVLDSAGTIHSDFFVSAVPFSVRYKDKIFLEAKKGEQDFTAIEFLESLH